jgi:hypothetical protein
MKVQLNFRKCEIDLNTFAVATGIEGRIGRKAWVF